jgi:trigger factor
MSRLKQSVIVGGRLLAEGSEVPDGVKVPSQYLDDAANTAGPTAMAAGDDPADFKVEEVQAYLAGADDAEKERVLAAEAAGKNRSTITGS